MESGFLIAAVILFVFSTLDQPLSRNHVEEVVDECLKNKITGVDILGILIFKVDKSLFKTPYCLNFRSNHFFSFLLFLKIVFQTKVKYFLVLPSNI